MDEGRERDGFVSARVVDGLPTPAVLIDFRGVVRQWNGSAERVYGWPATAAIGRNFDRLVHTDHGAEGSAEKILLEVLQGNDWRGHFRHRTRAGAPLPMDCLYTPVRDPHGHPRACLVLLAPADRPRAQAPAAPGCRIVVADDHVLVRDVLCAHLIAEGFDVVGVAEHGLECVQVVRSTRPDLLLVDITMPQGSGIEVTRSLLRDDPDLSVVVLTMHADVDLISASLEAGARGYVTKNASVDELIAAIRAAMVGNTQVTRVKPEATERDQLGATLAERYRLSPRELEVLQHLVGGLTSKEIGLELGLSPSTVDSYRRRIFTKVDASSKAELVSLALRHGLMVA